MHKLISAKYQLFDATFVNANQFIGQNWQKLRLDEALKDQFLIGFANWTSLYYIYINPNKRTKAVVAEMKKTYKEMNALLNAFIQQIKYDGNLALTAQEWASLGVRKPKNIK